MEAEAGVTLRQVKLKVLYTFDVDHKNNHLARWPHVLEVQAAQLDDANIIGCVDLRTCLEAIMNASPELTSNADSDFTVYAFDYSEPDTPLVGQGMLSRALGRDSPEEIESEAMITGKITKNVMGLFSKNAQETLEVKLRLTPVAAASFRKRSGSVSSSPDVMQSQWSGLRPQSPMDTSGLEAMQRMLSEGGPPRDRSGSVHADVFYNHARVNSRPTSRAGTPVQQQQPYPSQRQHEPLSRPASRTGTRSVSHVRRDSFNSGYYSGEDNTEEGPARKRAKVQKVDHPSKSNLNIERQPDSLRVMASTASSVRLHRPVPLNPATAALQLNHSVDDPIRPPTPMAVPTKTGKPRGRPRKVISANLLRGPKPRASSPASQAQQLPTESSFSSPEEPRADSATSTPAELPSSPPVMPESHNLVTSPQLPPFLNEADSGFMSASLEDLFGDDGHLIDLNEYIHDKSQDLEPFDLNQIEARTVNNLFPNGNSMMTNLPPVFDEGNDGEHPTIEMEPPPPPPPPSKVTQHTAPSKASSFTTNHRPIIPAPRLAPALAPKSAQGPEVRRSQSSLPPIPASDPVGRTFHRSHTWAPDMSDAIMSDIITNDEQTKAKPRKRVGKEQTKARLENAIASGEMPPFCDNCGTIETPAWRRAYTKVFDCPWDDVETSLEPGECCYKEPLEHDDSGNIIKFKGYKSERRSDEKSVDDWTQICLCNPCGLWFHKSKFPRPPEKWQKKDPNEKKKRKRGSKAKKKTAAKKPMAVITNDATTPGSDDSSPDDTAAEGGDLDDNVDGMTVNEDDPNDENEPELPPMPHNVRGGSAEPANRGLKFYGRHRARPVGRQVKSSPVRIGNTRATAIEIDLTPQPLRRQLFPSPQSLKNKSNAAATKTHAEDLHFPSFVRRSPRLNKIRDVYSTSLESAVVVAVDGSEKENLAPVASLDDDGLDGLFDSNFEDAMLPPSTPTPKRRSERLLFKTPGKTPSREFGEGMSPNVRRTPKHLQSATTKPLGESKNFPNVAEMTPFSRTVHETLFGNDMGSLDYPQTPQQGSGKRMKRMPTRSNQDMNSLFDFPDLPSLKDSSPVGVDLMHAFDLSEMTTDHLNPGFHDLFSTDMPMPSSPPPAYFDFMSGKDCPNSDIWAEMTAHPNLEETDFLQVDVSQGELRRSPRKHAA